MFSLESLEYQKVLKILKKYCISDYSRQKLHNTQPIVHRKELDNIFRELKELVYVIDCGQYPELEYIHDTGGLLKKASKKGSFLDPQEILRIGQNIGSFKNLKNQLSSYFKNTPLLAKRVSGPGVPMGLKQKISAAIDRKGYIREDASEELHRITRKMKSLRTEIESILEGYFNSPQTEKMLQEKNVTIKEDRYVIPVKHSFKGRIQGIVHAESGSSQTLFVEPFSITSQNNQMKVLQKEKQNEIKRILVSLTDRIREHSEELQAIQEVLSAVDILLAKYNFMVEYRCSIPVFSTERELEIDQARHPLLREKPVPIDFKLSTDKTGVVITGPNTGGKTVALKTIGLLVTMAQSGIPVTAGRMKSFMFNGVYSDIGDEQSIEQSLSTFSSHINNIIYIIEHADPFSLVLIDELGAGTEPMEGGALGTAIMDYLVQNDVLSIVTTHFSVVKMYALKNPGIEVASVQFDPRTCRPTFRLVLGIPGRSNAMEIARQLGLKKEVLEKSREFMSDRYKTIDDIFKRVGIMEMEISSKKQEVSTKQKQLDQMIQRYQQGQEELKQKEHYLNIQYQKELQGLVSEYRKKLENSIKEIKQEKASRESIKKAKQEVEELEKQVVDARDQHPQGAPVEEIKTGATVQVDHEHGRTRGKVIDISEQKVTVQAGIFKLSVSRDKIQQVKEPEKDSSCGTNWDYQKTSTPSGTFECDVRGMRYEQAVNQVAKFLDNALLSNARTVYIIHGMGTGALQKGVWEVLKNYQHVERFDFAPPEQGGFGCTVVELEG
ncbi:MAG: endonuclease MutS2 [Spirochaetota bacterium]